MSDEWQAVDFAVLGMEALREELDRWKDAYAALRADFRTVEQQRDEAQEVARRCYSPHTSPLMNLDTGRSLNELVRWPWLMNDPVALDGDDLT